MNNYSIEYDDFAHCYCCDKVINLDREQYTVMRDETYCMFCADDELVPETPKTVIRSL
jgi:hypothetical protein